MRAAPDVFGNHRSHLNSNHAEFSDLTDLIDHRESDSGLCFTVNPDGGYRPVEVGCVIDDLQVYGIVVASFDK